MVVGLGLTFGMGVMLLRQPNPADLSEQEGKPSRQEDVMERPAGPDAEAMHREPSESQSDDEPAP